MTWVFDSEEYKVLNEVRLDILREPLARWKRDYSLETALDVGCGLGFFSEKLVRLGFQVTALDARPFTVREASLRVPGIKVVPWDMEDRLDTTKADLVLCVGLLYHLENPFRVIRNLSAATQKILVVESMVSQDAAPILTMREEGKGEDQGVCRFSFLPSQSCLDWMLRSEFPHITYLSALPDRVMLACARFPL